jgi:hypothetical protein
VISTASSPPMRDRGPVRRPDGWHFVHLGFDYGPYQNRREAAEDLAGLRSTEKRLLGPLLSGQLSPRAERALLRREGIPT